MAEIEEIAISKFKATCLAVLERVRRTGRPVRITRFGKPVAEIMPPAVQEAAERKLGAMMGTAEIVGDIVGSPWTPAELIEVEDEWLGTWDEQQASTKRPAVSNPHPPKRRSDKRRVPSSAR